MPSSNVLATLGQIVQFCTGLHCVLPGRNFHIDVNFLPIRDIERVFPEAQTCCGYVSLPITHSSKEIFFEYMDRGILLSIDYYGQA